CFHSPPNLLLLYSQTHFYPFPVITTTLPTLLAYSPPPTNRQPSLAFHLRSATFPTIHRLWTIEPCKSDLKQ
ncbi:hypothetical protein M8C21_005195, partial [Ambrosia artemisiifolia]